MRAHGIEVYDVPGTTEPDEAVHLARVYLQYAQQFREFYPLRDLKDLYNAELFVRKVEDQMR